MRKYIDGLLDKYGERIYEGCLVRERPDNTDIHGNWAEYEVLVKKGCVFFSFVRSEKAKNFPRYYMMSNILDYVEDVKEFTFADEWKIKEFRIVEQEDTSDES